MPDDAQAGHLTDDDVRFLRRALYGFLTVAAGSEPPQPRPVWFEVTGDRSVQLFTSPGAVRLRRLQKDPRASLVVASPVGERERWVSVSGSVTLHDDGAGDLLTRLAARYWDLGDPARAADLAAMSEQDWVRVVLHPVKVTRYAM